MMGGFSFSLRGVYSVWYRHAMVYRRTWKTNCIPPVSEPIIYLFAFGLGLSPLVGEVTYHGKTISYLEYIAPGMIGVGVLFQAYFEGAYGSFVRLKFQRTWEALLTAPLTFTDVYLGDLFWGATKGIIAGVLTGLVALAWGVYPPGDLVSGLPVIVLGALLFSAFGLYTAGLVRNIDQLNIPIHVIIVPMFVLCGTYFPRETLPDPLETAAAVLPLSSMVDLLRWDSELGVGWGFDALLMALWTISLTAFSWRSLHIRVFR